MTTEMVSIDPDLDAALTRWERHGRPGLPVRGFVLSRLPGRARRGIYHAATGAAVLEPAGHVLCMSPAPDRRHIALQLADRADEDGVLAVVDVASGRLRRYPGVRCRYEPMRWAPDSRSVELVARHPHSLVRLDLTSETISTTDVPDDARVRLFPAGPHGLLAESRPGALTRLLDRTTGISIGTFPAVVRVEDIGANVLVYDGTALHVLDPRSGTPQWSWRDRSLQITSLAVAGRSVYLIAVRAGRSVLLRIVDGTTIDQRPVLDQGAAVVASDLSADDEDVHALVEGPTLPPRAVPARDLLAPTPDAPGRDAAASTEWHEIRADDGARITVAVTSPTGLTGPAPLILTCYGGFGVANLPVFEPTIPAWVERGGRYAIAQVRGGSEHGRAWREAGRGRNKHRGIDDLACVARGLVDAGLTRPGLLILAGASHGGVLAASCALGDPGLCAAVVTTAAPLDLLSLHAHPLGPYWTREFGDPDSPEGLAEIRRISPLHLAQTLPDGLALPQFLGIVLADDSRVGAEATHLFTEALRAKGAHASVWQAEETGHGSNHLDSLHRLGTTVLSFAATAVSLPAPTSVPATQDRLPGTDACS